MSIRLDRRRFIGSLALAGIFGAINPLGLLKLRSAYGSIPTGDYLSDRDPSRFWFRKLQSDTSGIANRDTLKPIESPEGQLSLRIGGAGGFAIGFLSTLNFLAKYKSTQPNDYIDLISNASRIPATQNRISNILRLLEVHRRTAGTPFLSSTWTLRNRSMTGLSDSSAVADRPSVVDVNGPSKPLVLAFPLEEVSEVAIAKSFRRAAIEARTHRLSGDIGAGETPTEPIIWEEAKQLVQGELTSEFQSFSTSWEDRFAAIDVNRLIKYEDGKLKLGWVDDVLLALEFQNGIEHGRLAALANSAFNDVASLTGQEQGLEALSERGGNDPELVKRVSDKLVKLRHANEIAECFGTDSFWRFASDAAPFRPAVRLKIACALKSIDVGTRVVDFNTPFLPFDATRALGASDAATDKESNYKISGYITDSFGDPSVSRYSLPLVTATLPQAAFHPCREMVRHTVRLLESVNQKNNEIFKNSSIESLVAVPEVTSPWTFAGVSAAFCNTYLMALGENQLNTEEARAGYRRSVGMSVDMLLKQSVGRGAPGSPSAPDLVANSSSVTPALVQYASGYRAAIVFADRATEAIAQAEGARKVYRNLQIAMPEYFKDLADDKFLPAEVIAAHVLIVATSVQSEIDRLREEVKRLQLRVEQLEATVMQYQKFITEFRSLVDSLQSQLTGVRTQDDLKKFQEKNQELVKRLTSAFDDSQRSMVGSLQGLVNTFVVISNEITVNVTAEFNARVAEKAKVQVNACSIGNQK